MRRTALIGSAVALVAATVLVASCSNPAARFPVAVATPQADNGLKGLFGSGPATEIKDNLANPVPLALPARVGLVFYGESGTPTANNAAAGEDRLIAIQQIDAQLRAANVAKSVVQIPASLIGPNETLDNIRKLASRFGVDVVIFVSSAQSVTRSFQQPSGFFDQFSSRSNFEARTVLTALALDVLSGRFLAPFQAIGKAGPTLLNPDEAGYQAASDHLQSQSEANALLELKNQILQGLQANTTPASAAPGASASPSASPAASPSAGAAPSASPSASASPAAQP